MVIAVGDHFRDDDAKRRHHIEIEDDCLAVASKRNAAVRRRLINADRGLVLASQKTGKLPVIS